MESAGTGVSALHAGLGRTDGSSGPVGPARGPFFGGADRAGGDVAVPAGVFAGCPVLRPVPVGDGGPGAAAGGPGLSPVSARKKTETGGSLLT